MTRAVLQKGVIYPLEPLPPDWEDGIEVNVEKIPARIANGSPAHPTEQWMDEVEACAAHIPEEEDERLGASLAQIRQQAKELARQGKM